MSMINREVSDFRTYAFHENDFKFVSREDILGKWSVFFFYPADFTFVCPTELEDLADKYEQFRSIGCEIYAVSTDTHFVHKAWHDASERIRKIHYPMLADPTHCISRDFEVLIESDGLAERGTFIINPEGKIVGYEVPPAMWAVTRRSCCARYRLASLSMPTVIRSAPPTGRPVQRR